MITNPTISTVIPTYNRSGMLKKTVMSVLKSGHIRILRFLLLMIALLTTLVR